MRTPIWQLPLNMEQRKCICKTIQMLWLTTLKQVIFKDCYLKKKTVTFNLLRGALRWSIDAIRYILRKDDNCPICWLLSPLNIWLSKLWISRKSSKEESKGEKKSIIIFSEQFVKSPPHARLIYWRTYQSNTGQNSYC